MISGAGLSVRPEASRRRYLETHVALFQSFWFGDVVPLCQTLCMKSFVDRGHEYDLYSYSEQVVPKGVRQQDANQILPRDDVFFYRRGEGAGSVAGFANKFRYRLLMLRGGWWVDTDVLCLSSTEPKGDTFFAREDEHRIGSAILKFPRNNSTICALYEESLRAGKDLFWTQTGPLLITTLAMEAGLWGRAEVPNIAYPIHYNDWLLPVQAATQAAAQENIRSASFLHLWNEAFRRGNSLALDSPEPGSLLADFYEKHDVR